MSERVNILIVEDNAILSMGLRDTLSSGAYQVADITDNGMEALDVIKKNNIDAILININIKGEWNGIETARQLIGVKDIPFIFLTSNSDGEMIKRAKDTFPAAYLVKPYQPQNLLTVIDLAIRNYAYYKDNPSKIFPFHPSPHQPLPDQKDAALSSNDTFFFKQNNKYRKVGKKQIYFLKAGGDYTHIITQKTKFTLRYTLKELLDKLDNNDFVRIHRSYAINIQHINNFNSFSVLIGDRELPIGRTYKKDFMKRFNFL